MMSRAGNELAVVQAFARHSPSMIIRYLKDAVLGHRGGNIRTGLRRDDKRLPRLSLMEKLDAQLTLPDLEARAQKILAKRIEELRTGALQKLSKHFMTEATDRVVEEALRQVQLREDKKLTGTVTLAELELQIRRMDLDIQGLSGELKFTFVRNPDGLLHRALDRGSCPCGWQWRKFKGTPVTQSEWDRACQREGAVCPRCR